MASGTARRTDLDLVQGGIEVHPHEILLAGVRSAQPEPAFPEPVYTTKVGPRSMLAVTRVDRGSSDVALRTLLLIDPERALRAQAAADR